MRVGHPSLRRLQRWLDGGEHEIDKHLATCERCAQRIEALGANDSALREPLLDLLAPPADVGARLRGGIDERLRSREDLALFSELFGIPIRTARIMTASSSTRGDS